jgi:REP element-mobilizing transposase RayT
MMKNNKIKSTSQRRRKQIRLREYDYSMPGAYFITICTKNRECLFGHIADGKMILNDAGRMVQTVWDEIPQYYPGIETDEFIIMPTHIHGIIVIVGAGPRACPDDAGHPPHTGHPRGGAPTFKGQSSNNQQPQGVGHTMSLPDLVHRLKTLTTKRFADGVKQHGWQPFPGKLWQRNYYEHVIRNGDELNRARIYIINNPQKWAIDQHNPEFLQSMRGEH